MKNLIQNEQREEQMKAYWARRDREEKTGNIYGWENRTRARGPVKKGNRWETWARILVPVVVIADLAVVFWLTINAA